MTSEAGNLFMKAEKHLPHSVEEAVKQGVPEEEAVRLYRECSRKIESGEWVEIFREHPRYGKSSKHPDSSSVCRYWGTREQLEELMSREQGVTFRGVRALYRRGEIGKTHELVTGSDKYPRGYEKEAIVWVRKPMEGRLPEDKITPGSQVGHRHWELADMYRYMHRTHEKELLISYLLILVLSGSIVFLNSEITGAFAGALSHAGIVKTALALAAAVASLLLLSSDSKNAHDT